VPEAETATSTQDALGSELMAVNVLPPRNTGVDDLQKRRDPDAKTEIGADAEMEPIHCDDRLPANDWLMGLDAM